MPNDRTPRHDHQEMPSTSDGRGIASKMILDAEKFRGEINKPQGMKNLDQFLFCGIRPVQENEVIDDDEFFHVTCHIERGLMTKIQNGEFVELEKLLVKDRFKKRSSDDRLEFITHEGQTYLAPASDKDNKIYGLHKWEQAFRVYATIYSKANPSRSAEIWQYIHTINMAAANYAWENVAYYDFTFRQMMSHNPNCSWAKIYSQLWNLVMCTPLQKFSNNYSSGGNRNYNNQNGQARSMSGGHNKKINHPCWKFNKNQPCSPGCEYEHKCSYCGMFGHSVLDCNKLFSKKAEGRQQQHRSGGHNQGNGTGSSSNSNNNNNSSHQAGK